LQVLFCYPGGNFSEEKFPPGPLSKDFETRVRFIADPKFYHCDS